MRTTPDCSPARFFDEDVRAISADARRERHHDGLGADEPASDVDVAAHAIGVDLETLNRFERAARRSPCERKDLRQRLPFDLPAAQPTLMFLRHGGKETCHEVRHSPRRPRMTAHATGLRLCGIVEDPPRPSAAGSDTSPTSVLHQQRDVSRSSFQERPRNKSPSAAGQIHETIAVRMPWQIRLGPRFSSAARERGYRRAPPHRATRGIPAAPPNCSTHAASPACSIRLRARSTAAHQASGFQTEGDGDPACCSHVRPTMGVSRHGPAPGRCQRVGELSRLRQESRSRPRLQLKHETGVDRILAGGTPVNAASRRRIFSRRRAAVSSRHERDRQDYRRWRQPRPQLG